MTMPSTHSYGRRPKSAKARNRGQRALTMRRVLWGLYEGGTVKPDFWALSLSCILLFDLKSPFFRPDPGVCGARRARSVKDGAIAPPSGLVLD